MRETREMERNIPRKKDRWRGRPKERQSWGSRCKTKGWGGRQGRTS